MAVVGRKPKPTHLKILEGEKNKDRINLNEPKPTPIAPKCPTQLSREAKKMWRMLAKELERLGLLTQVDGAIFATVCQAYARWIEAEKEIQQGGLLIKTPNGSLQISPMLSIANKAMEQMRKGLAEMGMTPSSRSRITVTPQGEDDDWDKILD